LKNILIEVLDAEEEDVRKSFFVLFSSVHHSATAISGSRSNLEDGTTSILSA
jgi:hypothetical protein